MDLRGLADRLALERLVLNGIAFVPGEVFGLEGVFIRLVGGALRIGIDRREAQRLGQPIQRLALFRRGRYGTPRIAVSLFIQQ